MTDQEKATLRDIAAQLRALSSDMACVSVEDDLLALADRLDFLVDAPVVRTPTP